MGFRNIHAFNLAMLAKQAWQLVTGAQSLFYRVYKARYFPRCSFLEAELGPNPSFVWRSLCAARELIIEGSQWQIGNGQSITINNQKWLPRPPLFKPGADTSLKVGDLIDTHTMQWDRPRVQDIFMPPTQQDVLNIRLGDLRTQDRIYWKENKANRFTVRSAYFVALRLNQGGVVEHSRAHEDKRLWNKIWRLRVPPKVRNFLWRACSDILPTRANIVKRRLPIDPSCAICGQAEESVCHALWECPLATNVWALVKGKLQKSSAVVQDFHSLARQMEDKLTGKEMEVWAMVAWSIWNARNRFYFEKKQSQPGDILHSAMSLIQDYQRLNQHLAGQNHPT